MAPYRGSSMQPEQAIDMEVGKTGIELSMSRDEQDIVVPPADNRRQYARGSNNATPSSNSKAVTKGTNTTTTRKSRMISLVLGIAAIVVVIIGIVVFLNKNASESSVSNQGTVSASSLQQHGDAADCWVLFHGKVYDMTEYAPTHPGGTEFITDNCGKDATGIFDTQHPQTFLKLVDHYIVGSFVGTSGSSSSSSAGGSSSSGGGGGGGGGGTTSSNTISAAILQQHSSKSDCWVVFHNTVYDMTDYASNHPGGQKTITQYCGQDGSTGFDGQHPSSYLNKVSQYKKGAYGESTSAGTGSSGTSASTGSSGTSSETTASDTNNGDPSTETITNSDTISAATLQQHNSQSDCWVVFQNTVYDMTGYAAEHPGGSRTITKYCGQDGTSGFSSQHPSSYLNKVSQYQVGAYGDGSTTSNSGGTSSGESENESSGENEGED